MTETHAPLKLVVLISGRGSNLKAILEAIENGELSAVVSAVISDRNEATGLAYARERSIDTLALNAKDYPDREGFDAALLGLIDLFHPGLVVLAGYMRILSSEFVTHYAGRLINIHPSLLPEFRGLDTHRRAIEARCKTHGASVHFVTEELDGGPVVAQVRIPVLPDDTAESLSQRVLEQEHPLYVKVIQWVAESRLTLNGNTLSFDNKILEAPIQREAK
ncbi:Phosphoribosylglycinamide formyltransferase [hydrothermal vent metagenome]|uniref:phosphoribosylglycinamide formyltransferase 1 n=1 Tax=hydrothermal vent metagenome TaxID=652676 RepID=A0A3B0YB94_9ZZZZ